MNFKNYLSTLSLILFALTVTGQTTNGCGTKLSKQEQTKFRQTMSKMKNRKQFNKRASTQSYKIPVIFHVLHNGEGDGPNNQNEVSKETMECRINDVMQVVNKDFRGEYPGFNTTDPRFDAVKSKMDNIEFILAKEDPDGNLLETPGMNWQADGSLVEYGYDQKITNDPWWWGKNGKYYLQVFVVHYPNDKGKWNGSGHAFLPVQDAFPRIVYNWRYIGTKSSCGGNTIPSSSGFEKVMSHEFGHYFGLKHTFNGSTETECDTENDGIADTPPTLGTEGCQRNKKNACGVYPNLENHMDYNTACQNMFTKDQVAVMNMWLEDTTEAKYPRSLLWQPSNLISTGIVPSAPTAKFKSNETAICNNNTIQFKDVSTGLPTSRLWSFEGGTPSSSTEANPTITYNTAGKFKVTLKVTNTLGQNTTQSVEYINVDQYATNNTFENFEGTFPPKGWSVNNPDSELAWEKRNDVGNGDTSCIIMNNANNNNVGEKDYLRLPFYDFSNATKAQMYFDVAYVKFDADSPDVLKVEVSKDCGNTWTEAYSKTHIELETTISAISPNDWVPNKPEHWRKEIIDLSAYDGEQNLTFRFKNISGFGTRIWVDNVSISLKNNTAPQADFYTKKRNSVCNSEQVEFNDTSSANPTSWAWSFPGGTPTSSTDKNPVINYNGPGSYNITLTVTNNFGSNTVTKTDFIVLKTPTSQSFTENFSGTFPPTNWETRNFDGGLEFEQGNAGNGDNSCMVMNNADNSNVGELDEILLPSLDLSAGATDFYFDLAYTKFNHAKAEFNTDSPDKLKVLVSKDCGQNWTTLYNKTHTELQTVEILDDLATANNEPNDWVPSKAEHWRKERVILNDYQGESNVLVKFVNESGFGTRIWIDNVTITTDSKEKPTSNFEKEDKSICLNSSVQFSDTSTGIPTTWNWVFEGGTPAVSNVKNPLITYNQSGTYKVQLTTSNAFGQGTTAIKTEYVTVKGKNTLPYSEDFTGVFPISDWEIINPDNDEIKWEKRNDAGNGDTSCLVINNADNPKDKVDELILKPFDFSVNGEKKMEFDLAYTKYNNVAQPDVVSDDKLSVLISTNCGATWTEVYNKTHTELETFEVLDDPATPDETEPNDWIPTEASHWRKESIDLSTYAGNSNVLIKLKNISGFGTRIWIDNLNVTSTVDNIEYCESAGNRVQYEWIAGVKVGDFTNTSTAAKYLDFTKSKAPIPLSIGTETPIVLTPGNSGNADKEYFKIWIDYDKSGTFDTNEVAFDSGSAVANAQTGTITLPTTALLGITRMRISMKYNRTPASSCGNIGDGSVQDYNVNISGIATPAPVAAFTSNSTAISSKETVSFTDQSTNTPTAWSWSFSGGTPSVSTEQNPAITYNTAGIYEVTLTVTNAGGNNVITKTNYITVTDVVIPTVYCESAGNRIQYEWISGVQLGEFNKTSAPAKYSDFTTSTAAIPLSVGTETSLTLTPGYSGSAAKEYFKVWIDYDRNGTFDSNEIAFDSGSAVANVQTGTITVPTTAIAGNTRMRISMKYNKAPTNSCGNIGDGSVQDFTVNIRTQSARKVNNQLASVNSIQMYPNPVSKELVLRFGSLSKNSKTNLNITILDITGKVIRKMKDVKNKESVRFNVENLKNGMYILQTINGNEVDNRMFVKE